MRVTRAWKYRIYPTNEQIKILNNHLWACKTLWNSLLEYTKNYYKETKKFPNKTELCKLTKQSILFSQVAQNMADKLIKAIWLMIKKIGEKKDSSGMNPGKLNTKSNFTLSVHTS